MYGMTGKLTAQAGKRDQLIEILLRAADLVGKMSGCRLYAVTEDIADETTVWVMEIWDSKESHDGSLKNEQVRALISEAMPLMGGKPDGAEMRIRGGFGV